MSKEPNAFDPEEFGRGGGFANQYMVDALYAELLGLCRGVLADHQLVDEEIVALDTFLTEKSEYLPEWPCRRLAHRVKEILSDGWVDDDERAELKSYIDRMAGGQGSDDFDSATSLPLTEPPPHIEYEGHKFCLTGTFVYGRRREVSLAIERAGGVVVAGVTSSLNYLVIGATATPSWKYGKHGLKILSAVEANLALAERGLPLIGIVSEEHWSCSLC